MKSKIGGEGLLPEADDFTEEEKRFNEFLLSNFRLDEENIVVLRDLALGIEPKEIPTALSEDAKQRVIRNVLALLEQRLQRESSVGAMLAQYRQWRGISLRQQAQELGVEPEAVHALEEDPAPVSVLSNNKAIGELARKYGIAFWKLLGLIRDAFAFTSLRSQARVPSVSFARTSERLEEEEYQALIDKILQSTLEEGTEDAMER